MKIVSCLLLAAGIIFVGGCAPTEQFSSESDATPSSTDATSLSEVVDKTLAQSELGRSSGYYMRMASHWMGKQLPTKGRCNRVGDPSKLYLRIEANGSVSGVYGDPENDRSRCYRQAYTGLRVPEPPAAPFYMSLDIG